MCSTALLAALTGCAGAEPPSLVVYAARSGGVVAPLIDDFEATTGTDLRVRYGDGAEIVARLTDGSEAGDVVIADVAGELAALDSAGLLHVLPEAVLEPVPPAARGDDGTWVGITGRARAVAYNPHAVPVADLPDSLAALAGPAWRGAVGWAPATRTFQEFVTALRVLEGDDAARAWLEAMLAGGVVTFPSGIAVAHAVADGEVAIGLTDEAYVRRLLDDDPAVPLAVHPLRDGDPGRFVNLSGAAVLSSAGDVDLATGFVAFLLDATSQAQLSASTFESEVVTAPVLPGLDLGALGDVQGTLDLLHETGVLS